MKELLAVIEKEFKIIGEKMYKHHEAKKWLPEIVAQPEANFSIVQASKMKGKTVDKVEFGFRKETEYSHKSEALIIYFTDGSIMGLDTGSNVGNIVTEENNLHPNDFHVDFTINWVPSP